jgi:hypothetical protein
MFSPSKIENVNRIHDERIIQFLENNLYLLRILCLSIPLFSIGKTFPALEPVFPGTFPLGFPKGGYDFLFGSTP